MPLGCASVLAVRKNTERIIKLLEAEKQ